MFTPRTLRHQPENLHTDLGFTLSKAWLLDVRRSLAGPETTEMSVEPVASAVPAGGSLPWSTPSLFPFPPPPAAAFSLSLFCSSSRYLRSRALSPEVGTDLVAACRCFKAKASGLGTSVRGRGTLGCAGITVRKQSDGVTTDQRRQLIRLKSHWEDLLE